MATALVTGASSGLGAQFAARFAARGDDVVLVARRKERLDALADRLGLEHRVTATSIALDLAAADAAQRLHAELDARALVIDTLVNCAGFGTHGDVADADPARLADEIAVNCQALVGLTARLLPGMLERGTGTIVNIASTAGFQPIPHMAVYSATKAFVLTFTQALWAEVKDRGIRVLAVCPGATDTEFFDVAGEAAAVGRKRTPEQLVDHAMHALEGSGPTMVDGFANGALGVLARVAPRRLVIAGAERSVRA